MNVLEKNSNITQILRDRSQNIRDNGKTTGNLPLKTGAREDLSWGRLFI